MVIDLISPFLDAVAGPDPVAAYRRFIAEHDGIYGPYWHHHVLDPADPNAHAVIERTALARRDDLHRLQRRVDLNRLAATCLAQCETVLRPEGPVDLYLMVGTGGPRAGELVVGGRGIAFVCVEHFTGRANPETLGLGLRPELLPVWAAHQVAHTVRYTAPSSRSSIAQLVSAANGHYDYWEAGSQVELRELLINEGLAVAASREVAPGFDEHVYFGYSARHYRRLRQLEAALRRGARPDLRATGLGFRLRYLAGGASATSRLVNGTVLPERSGYYLGYRMAEPFTARHGVAAALRAAADAILDGENPPTG